MDRKSKNNNNDPIDSKPLKRFVRSSFDSKILPAICLFSNGDNSQTLHDISTLQVDANIKECARQLNDFTLLAKIQHSDLIALEGKYHLQCLNKYYRNAQRASAANDDVQLQDDKHVLAFAELVTCIQGEYAKDSSTIFKSSTQKIRVQYSN